jgi:hypothetical protein
MYAMWILLFIGTLPVIYLGGIGFFGKEVKKVVILAVEHVFVFLGIIMIIDLLIGPVVIALIEVFAALLTGQSL